MGDKVCKSHVNKFMSMHWSRRCRLCWSERPSAVMLPPASNPPNRTCATASSGSFKSYPHGTSCLGRDARSLP